jgi:hypothetical protein
MQHYQLVFSRRADDGVEWRLGSARWSAPAPFEPGRDPSPWTGRIRAGLEVTHSSLGDTLNAKLQFADDAGRLYELESPCGAPEHAQSLELLDERGERVWIGRFSFG